MGIESDVHRGYDLDFDPWPFDTDPYDASITIDMGMGQN